MQTLLTNKTVSLTEMRNPGKIIADAGNKPVAILNRNKVEGYFVPVSAVDKISFESASSDAVAAVLAKRKAPLAPIVKYLQDK